MAVEQIKETDTLNQGRVKINDILDQSNASVETVNGYRAELNAGIADAKKIADDAGKEAVQIATDAGEQANETAEQALANSQTAITTADRAVSTANNNKQEFDSLRNDFDKLVAESGDSNPEIVQARTDTQGITRPTLATRLQVDFNERMTKAEGISLFTGSTNVKKMMDFNGKTAGNTAVNPHKYFSDFTATTLKKPMDVWNEVSQTDYNKLASRDDSGIITGSTQNGVIPQHLASFDVVEEAKRLTPQIYEGLDRTQSATLLKTNFVSFTIGVRVKATSPNNKNIKVATYLQSTDSWTNQIQENATDYVDLTVQVNDKNFITNDGYIHLVSYTDASNGVSSSSLDMDYCGVQIELTVNAQKILDAAGYAKQSDIENITKEDVGLGNVQNFGIATQSEAQSGKIDNKYMTPLKTTQTVKAMLLELTYPIGSIYQSVKATDPASLFGGEWERIVGKTLVGVDEGDSDFNTSEKTGGSKKQSYGINENNAQAQLQLSGTTVAGNVKTTSSYTATIRNTSTMTFSNQTMSSTGGIGVRGATEEGNNLQPYFTAYMWLRVG